MSGQYELLALVILMQLFLHQLGKNAWNTRIPALLRAPPDYCWTTTRSEFTIWSYSFTVYLLGSCQGPLKPGAEMKLRLGYRYASTGGLYRWYKWIMFENAYLKKSGKESKVLVLWTLQRHVPGSWVCVFELQQSFGSKLWSRFLRAIISKASPVIIMQECLLSSGYFSIKATTLTP